MPDWMPPGEGSTGSVRATDPYTERSAPWTPEAEISVLGGMLIDADAVAKAMESVDDSMFYREGNRSYMNIALGCTGGQHRSVYLADRLYQHYRNEFPNINIRHRELQ